MTIQQEIKLNEILTLAHHDYEKGLNARAFFKVNDHALGEDLVQATFLKTWKYLVKGGDIVTMKAFLYHILNDLIIDEYRKHKATSLDALLVKGFEPSIDDRDRTLNILDGEVMFGLIRQLPKKYQVIMLMKFEEDLSLGEMSDITRQSKNAIAVQVYRGLEKIRKLYDVKYI